MTLFDGACSGLMRPAYYTGSNPPSPADLDGSDAIPLERGVFVPLVLEDGVARVLFANEWCTAACYAAGRADIGRGYCLPELDFGLPEGTVFATRCTLGGPADSVEACEQFIDECADSIEGE